MSGIGGCVTTGGIVPPDLVEAMTAALARRGPDESASWRRGRAGVVSCLFRTTHESATERQPVVYRDRVVFVGDVRLDARADLAAAIAGAAGPLAVTVASSDAELAFASWLCWGDACASRLLGDFAFAVYDDERGRLFAARDHFGVRPLHYAVSGDRIVFASSIAAVQAGATYRSPGAASAARDVDAGALDDCTIVDLLAFRYVDAPDATPFKAIRRLPPGHVLSWHDGHLSIASYWSGPSTAPVRFRREADYVDRYRELFDLAVRDRVRTGRVAVAMTGGVDSSAIAVSAARAPGGGAGPDVVAHTIVYDRLIPDEERRFATLAARHAGLQHECFVADDWRIHQDAGDSVLQQPEPIHDPFRAMVAAFYRRVASGSRVVLMGLDGDSVLSEIAGDHLLGLLRRGRFGAYLSESRAYVRATVALPPHRIRTGLLRRLGFGRPDLTRVDPIPDWIDGSVRRAHDLDARRARRLSAAHAMQPGWPVRPRFESVFRSPRWRAMFDRHDAEYLGAPIEARFPFADLRLVEFLLNIPAIPWRLDKRIHRAAMRDRLPVEVLDRPKTSLAGDPIAARIQAGDRLPWSGDDFLVHPRLGDFVNLAALDRVRRAEPTVARVETDTRALSLNEWLWYHLPRS